MPSFQDEKKREWTIRLDALLIEQVREDCDPKFLLGEPTETLTRLDEDPVLLCNTIWVLCRDQARERGIEQADFYSHVIGDSIDAAADALVKAAVSFTRGRQRELLTVGAAKNDKLRTLVSSRALATLNDPTLEDRVAAAIDAEIAKILTPLGNAGDSQDSSESTRAE